MLFEITRVRLRLLFPTSDTIVMEREKTNKAALGIIADEAGGEFA